MSDPKSGTSFDRRSVLRALAIAAPVAALAACAPTEKHAAVKTPTATPTPTATETIGVPAASAARPAGIRSYGPNGTHWPAHTPWFGDSGLKVVEVACTWAAIATAIGAVTPAQAKTGVHIKVKPGTLPGMGASSGSKNVLQGLGSTSWAKNVLVSPRDGWGTVNISDPARLRDVAGVTFARINANDLLLTNCNRTVWAQSKVSKGFRMTSSYGATTSQCGAYEIVMADAKADISDPLGYAAGDGCVLIDCVWEGCYAAPVFRPTGATDHVDTIQMFGSGWYRGLTLRDTMFFGSLNCALQIGGSRPDDPNAGKPFLTLDHSIVTSQATAIKVRYPLPSGADVPSITQAINGIGEPGQLYANDSMIFGSMYKSSWGTVSNTKVAYQKAIVNNPVANGSWTYDSSMDNWGANEFNNLSPTPTDAYLAKIWK